MPGLTSRWLEDGFRRCDVSIPVPGHDVIACPNRAVSWAVFRRTDLPDAIGEAAACAADTPAMMASLRGTYGLGVIAPLVRVHSRPSGWRRDAPDLPVPASAE